MGGGGGRVRGEARWGLKTGGFIIMCGSGHGEGAAGGDCVYVPPHGVSSSHRVLWYRLSRCCCC